MARAVLKQPKVKALDRFKNLKNEAGQMLASLVFLISSVSQRKLRNFSMNELSHVHSQKFGAVVTVHVSQQVTVPLVCTLQYVQYYVPV